ncbi:hypothetical protein MA16_Dca004283 [Dendrobium catenatum]|uniref:DUF4371 domain-containing protein n=1 Tax=Dendrobium catenatum TaxID=906689 RepID=A0A2I0W719_9ASPA|nr:hypothetical protein MA16_Dca004283 [Dendrobium catenatum]
MKDICNSYFSIIVDESRDISMKEQVSYIVVRYVDKLGQVIERFICIKYVTSTAFNMREEFHGLKALILNDNPQAFYIHCFAHQLQLCLVVVSKKF